MPALIHPYIQATALGMTAGLRSMLPIALLNRNSNSLAPAVLALGEVVGTRLPVLPTRTKQGPLIARVVIGGTAGALLFQQQRRPMRTGAALGAIGATAGAFLGSYGRKKLSRSIPLLPDRVWNGAEDILAFGLGRLATAGRK